MAIRFQIRNSVFDGRDENGRIKCHYAWQDIPLDYIMDKYECKKIFDDGLRKKGFTDEEIEEPVPATFDEYLNNLLDNGDIRITFVGRELIKGE